MCGTPRAMRSTTRSSSSNSTHLPRQPPKCKQSRWYRHNSSLSIEHDAICPDKSSIFCPTVCRCQLVFPQNAGFCTPCYLSATQCLKFILLSLVRFKCTCKQSHGGKLILKDRCPVNEAFILLPMTLRATPWLSCGGVCFWALLLCLCFVFLSILKFFLTKMKARPN